MHQPRDKVPAENFYFTAPQRDREPSLVEPTKKGNALLDSSAGAR